MRCANETQKLSLLNVEDYILSIDGCTYDEESQAITTSSEKTVSGKGGGVLISGNGTHIGKQAEEVKRSVKISDAAKFDKIYKYLQSEDDDGLKYYEFLSNEVYAELNRDDFLEVLVTARFSKMRELAESVSKITELVTVFETITDQKFLDKKTSDAFNGITALGQLKSGKEIVCVFEFEDRQFPLIAHLDESYFRCGKENFVGQAYLLCKIIRKIPKGQSVKLDEIFDDIKKFPLNRTQKRKMPKNMDNPEGIRDIVKGPAFAVVPVAVYQ